MRKASAYDVGTHVGTVHSPAVPLQTQLPSDGFRKQQRMVLVYEPLHWSLHVGDQMKLLAPGFGMPSPGHQAIWAVSQQVQDLSLYLLL